VSNFYGSRKLEKRPTEVNRVGINLAIFIIGGKPDRFNTVQLRSEEPLLEADKNSRKPWSMPHAEGAV
jgi:hypothetical protein